MNAVAWGERKYLSKYNVNFADKNMLTINGDNIIA
jgi:hypothetical protein